MKLTKKVIEGMEAGPALDALVASHVMGLKPCKHWVYSSIMRIQECWVRTDPCPHKTVECFWVNHPTEYSQNISAAWLICQKLHFIGLQHYRAGGYYEAAFLVGKHPKERLVSATGQSAPIAICKAALLATL